MRTIFDTDFLDEDKVMLYRGAEFAWSGEVGDMTEELKQELSTAERFLLDQRAEGFRALFID